VVRVSATSSVGFSMKALQAVIISVMAMTGKIIEMEL
jgi:hypothetical protein